MARWLLDGIAQVRYNKMRATNPSHNGLAMQWVCEGEHNGAQAFGMRRDPKRKAAYNRARNSMRAMCERGEGKHDV